MKRGRLADYDCEMLLIDILKIYTVDCFTDPQNVLYIVMLS